MNRITKAAAGVAAGLTLALGGAAVTAQPAMASNHSDPQWCMYAYKKPLSYVDHTKITIHGGRLPVTSWFYRCHSDHAKIPFMREIAWGWD